jgi:hypothetical protein
MARYAGSGKNTVEGCRSIDVLEWHRRGYLRSPRWFSWTWTRDGERVASINVETQRHSVLLKYRSRFYGEDWSDVEQRVTIAWKPCRFGGERPWFVCSVASNWSVLRPPGHQAVRCRATVRLPSLLSACLCEPAGSGASTRAVEITKNPNSIGWQPEHARRVSRQAEGHALADV